jgi:inhibitor of KinA
LLNYIIFPLCEDAVLIQFGQSSQNLKEQITAVQKASQFLNQNPFIGFRELVPAYHTITIYYDPVVLKNGSDPFQTVKLELESLLASISTNVVVKKRYVEIPVCYEGDFALDINELADANNLTVKEVVQLHTNTVYDVTFIGFAPGFPFLSGLDSRLYFPRKKSPRLKVEQGSVGIAGNQTGIYPLDSPGGWQIIGRTPINLFNVESETPTLLKAGDQVKFYPITQKEYWCWEESIWE